MRGDRVPAMSDDDVLDGLIHAVDLDGLDPSFAPAVAHPEPGGLSTRELLRILQAIQGYIVAADIVELNPSLDPTDQTAKVAAKVCKELLARLGEVRSM